MNIGSAKVLFQEPSQAFVPAWHVLVESYGSQGPTERYKPTQYADHARCGYGSKRAWGQETTVGKTHEEKKYQDR